MQPETKVYNKELILFFFASEGDSFHLLWLVNIWTSVYLQYIVQSP